MKTTTGSSHNVYPNADPAAPQANPTGAPAVQPAPPSGPQSTAPRSFNVDRAGSKAASGNNTLSAAKVGAPSTQDTIDQASSKRVAGSAPAGGAKPTPAPKGPSPGSRQPLRAKPVDPAKLTAEDLLQRLRYFENLDEVRVAYIKTLQALVSRTGTAVPAQPHVKTFLSPAGNVDPNAQVAYP